MASNAGVELCIGRLMLSAGFAAMLWRRVVKGSLISLRSRHAHVMDAAQLLHKYDNNKENEIGDQSIAFNLAPTSTYLPKVVSTSYHGEHSKLPGILAPLTAPSFNVAVLFITIRL